MLRVAGIRCAITSQVRHINRGNRCAYALAIARTTALHQRPKNPTATAVRTLHTSTCVLHPANASSPSAAATIPPPTPTPSTTASIDSPGIPHGWLFLADMHFSKDHLSRLEDTCRWIVGEVERLRPKHIFILGDTLHTRNEVHVEASSAVATFLRQLLQTVYPDGEEAPHVHVLVGNHDMHHRSSRAVTSLDSFAVFDPTAANNSNNDPLKSLLASTGQLQGQPQPTATASSSSSLSPVSSTTPLRLRLYREITLVELDGHEVLFVPYHDGEECALIEAYVAELAKTKDLSKIVVLAHLPLTGAKISGIALETSTQGMAYAKTSVSLTTLNKFNRTFLGHFHIHQLVGSSGKILYCGAPLQFNYGDANDDRKGFISYDPDEHDPTRPWVLCKNPYATHFISKPLAEWQTELAAASLSSAATATQSPYRLKCIEITLPPNEDPIQAEQLERQAKEMELVLREQCGVDFTKVKRLTSRASTSAAAAAQKQAKVAAGDDPLATDGPLSVDSDTPAATSSSSLPSSSDCLLDPISSNGDLRPLVDAYLNADQTLTPETRTTLKHTMEGLLDSLAHSIASTGTPSGSASPSSTGSRKLFHARLRQMEVTNFLSVYGTLRFDFQALKPGVWYIAGRNGSGKSLLLEALTWVLFGKTLRGHESDRVTRTVSGLAQDEVVNDRAASQSDSTGKAVVVKVRISFANGYVITRSHQHGQSGTSVRIETPAGEILLPKSSKKLDDASVVELLGISFDRFVSSVLLSSTTKNFISARAEEKRRVIEDLLGFTLFDSLHTEAKERRTSVLTERKKLEALTGVHQEQYLQWKRKCEELDRAFAKAQEDLKGKQADLLTLQEQSKEKQSTHAILEAQEKSSTQARETQSTVLVTIMKELDALRQGSQESLLTTLRSARSSAEADLAKAVHARLGELYAMQTSLSDRLSAVSRTSAERRFKESQDLQQRIQQLKQLEQARGFVVLAEQKLAAAQGPSWLNTLAQVLEILTSWVRSSLPESLREKFDQSVLQPLQSVVQEAKHALQAKDKVLSEAKAELAQRKEKVEQVTKGWSATTAVPDDISAALTELRAAQATMTKAHAQSSTKESQEAEQRAEPSYAELQKVREEIAVLQGTDLSASTHPDIVAALNKVATATVEIAQFDSSHAAHRASEATLSSQRRQEEDLLTKLTQAEHTARTRVKHSDQERQAIEVKKARKEKEVELGVEALTKLEAERKIAQEQGPSVSSTLAMSEEDLSRSSHHLAAYNFWVDRVSDAPTKQEDGFRSFCMRRVLGTLNPLLQENLELFSGDDAGRVSHPLSCALTPELNLVALPGTPSLEKRSEGQRKRTHLALFLALFTLSQRRSSFLNQFLFLDEAFDSLDEDGQKAVNAWIKAYAYGTSVKAEAVGEVAAPLVFVITHSSYTSPSVSNGCIRAALDSMRASTYTLDAPGYIPPRPFVQRIQEPTTTMMSEEPDVEETRPVKATRKKAATGTTSTTTRTKKTKATKSSAAADHRMPQAITHTEDVDASFM